MTKIVYRVGSPYAKTSQTSWYLDLLNPRNILEDPSDKMLIIEAKYEKRPDLLSYELYGTRDLWWVFRMLNPNIIKDPIYDFNAGKLIFIPTQDRLLNMIGGTNG